jgi:hypothetical protein
VQGVVNTIGGPGTPGPPGSARLRRKPASPEKGEQFPGGWAGKCTLPLSVRFLVIDRKRYPLQSCSRVSTWAVRSSQRARWLRRGHGGATRQRRHARNRRSGPVVIV